MSIKGRRRIVSKEGTLIPMNMIQRPMTCTITKETYDWLVILELDGARRSRLKREAPSFLLHDTACWKVGGVRLCAVVTGATASASSLLGLCVEDFWGDQGQGAFLSRALQQTQLELQKTVLYDPHS